MAELLENTLQAETMAARPQFEELLDFVIESTLRDPEIYNQKLAEIQFLGTPAVDDSARVAGLWAASHPMLRKGKDANPHVQDESEQIQLPFEDEVQDKIDALGQAILEEAFMCLGEDAIEKVIELQNATTLKDSVKVYNWLLRRVKNIGDIAAATKHTGNIGADETEGRQLDDDYFYHPARLSPKFIGEFPGIRTAPTCLGYSILIASFFEKAEIPYMHAGVVRTAKDEARRCQQVTIVNLIKAAENWGISLPPDLENTLRVTLANSARDEAPQEGFHAAVLVEASDTKWAQLDPNYNINVVGGADSGSLLGNIYDQLWAQSQLVGKGIEHKHVNHRSHATVSYAVGLALLAHESTESLENIDQFLQEVPEDTAYAEIVQNYFMDMFAEDDVLSSAAFNYTVARYCQKMGLNQSEYLQDAIYTALLKYVFPDAREGIIASSIARCKTDPAYRRRRVEDLKMLPLYVMLSLQSKHGNAIIDGDIKHAHSVVEVGLPAYRIGACVLSDFAVYCGDELPLSFWMTYWPSAISFAEHHTNTNTAAQLRLKAQVMSDMQADVLKYPVVNDIIKQSNE